MIVLSIFILYRIQAIVYRQIWNKKLQVLIQFQKTRVTEGESVMLEEILENRKWLPLPTVFLQFKLSKYFQVLGEPALVTEDRYHRKELMSVMMNQRLCRKVEVLCTKRGKYSIERASIVAQSLFLDETYTLELECNSKLTVYPRMVDARRFDQLIRSISGGQMMCSFMQEDPFLIRGVREYQIYDNIKSINWNATARTGNLKVNLLETVSNRFSYVFLNVQKESLAVPNEVVEESIRLAKTFCALFSKKGVKSQLYTNGSNGEEQQPICVERGLGVEYMSKINEALTRIFVDENGNRITHGHEQELDFVKLYSDVMEEAAKEGLVVIISNNQEPAIRKLLKKLHREGRQFLWIVPVKTMADYKEDQELKGHMRIWRLNFEGVREQEGIRQNKEASSDGQTNALE